VEDNSVEDNSVEDNSVEDNSVEDNSVEDNNVDGDANDDDLNGDLDNDLELRHTCRLDDGRGRQKKKNFSTSDSFLEGRLPMVPT
jgi:hypothetical protein